MELSKMEAFSEDSGEGGSSRMADKCNAFGIHIVRCEQLYNKSYDFEGAEFDNVLHGAMFEFDEATVLFREIITFIAKEMGTASLNEVSDCCKWFKERTATEAYVVQILDFMSSYDASHTALSIVRFKEFMLRSTGLLKGLYLLLDAFVGSVGV